jgi:site-specific recombinase XerC
MRSAQGIPSDASFTHSSDALEVGVRQIDLAGAAHLELVSGVVHLHPQDVMVEAMLRGWRAQQAARGLRESTAVNRERSVRRFLAFTTRRWRGPVNPLDNDHRWETARKLLHDTTIEIEDRLAGLLLLLYAQGPSTISLLTTDQISINDANVRISFGRTPIQLPEPVDELARTVVAKRKGHATIGATAASRWLFPGGQPGRPISTERLKLRLNRLGIREPGPQHCAVPARHRDPRSHPRQNSRRQRQLRRPLATDRSPPETGPATPPTSAAGLLLKHEPPEAFRQFEYPTSPFQT